LDNTGNFPRVKEKEFKEYGITLKPLSKAKARGGVQRIFTDGALEQRLVLE
jgi:hypothetical protein